MSSWQNALTAARSLGDWSPRVLNPGCRITVSESFGKRMNWVGDQLARENMARLLIHVEGETEETFVNEVLAPHLLSFGYESVSARLIGNARQRDRRGG